MSETSSSPAGGGDGALVGLGGVGAGGSCCITEASSWREAESTSLQEETTKSETEKD